MDQRLRDIVLGKGTKVILIHPMHFSINTPDFAYMRKIKQSMSREQWMNITKSTLDSLRWNGRGIRDLLVELLQMVPRTSPLGNIYRNVLKTRDHHAPQLESQSQNSLT